jgi:RecJ-like exonuclease
MCFTHSKDVDGLACASLLKRVYDADIQLLDYSEMLDSLKNLSTTYDRLYICDLGYFPSLASEFKRINSSMKVYYIDHHPSTGKHKQVLETMGATVIYSDNECAAALTYNHLKRKLPSEARQIAAYAIIVDYPCDGPITKGILQEVDKYLTSFEATILSYAITRSHENKDFKVLIANNLANLVYPHKINGLLEMAVEEVEKTVHLIETVKPKAKRLRNLVYMEVTDESTSILASLLIKLFPVPIGVAYKESEDGSEYYLSFRGREDCHMNLGTIIATTARHLGGIGGGHPLASGAAVPKEKVGQLFHLIDEKYEYDKIQNEIKMS